MILKYTVEVTIEIDRKVCSNLSTSQIEPSDTDTYCIRTVKKHMKSRHAKVTSAGSSFQYDSNS